MGLFLLYVNNCRIWLWTAVFVTVYFRVFLYCIAVRVWRTSTGLHRPAQSHLGPTPLPRHPISAQAQESGSCLSFARQIPISSPSFTLSPDRPQTYIIEQSHRSLVSGPVRWMCPRPVSSPHHSWGCWWMLLPAPDVGTCLACHSEIPQEDDFFLEKALPVLGSHLAPGSFSCHGAAMLFFLSDHYLGCNFMGDSNISASKTVEYYH